MSLSLHRRIALSFAAAVAAAVIVFAVGVAAALFIKESREVDRDVAMGIEPYEHSFDDVELVLYAIAVLAPLTIITAALAGRSLAQQALSPLQDASDRAKAARGGGFDLELPVRGLDDEWDDLARTLNALLADVRASMVRIQRFTADAAHELRTPLTAIIGEIDVTLRRERSDDEYRQSLSEVRSEARRLATLVDALLTLARLDDAQTNARTRVSLEALLEEAAPRAQKYATASGKAVEIELRDVGGEVVGDPLLLARVIDNLLDNAVRHGGRRITVDQTSSHEDDKIWLHLVVSDDGLGVAPELLPHLFERFARGDHARVAGGFGLGLPIARAIATSHGGDLRYDPTTGGSRFILDLPMAGA